MGEKSEESFTGSSAGPGTKTVKGRSFLSVLPPNFGDLSDEMRVTVEEEMYRCQLKFTHGYCPGDSRLTSISANGKEAVRSFGKAVEGNDDES